MQIPLEEMIEQLSLFDEYRVRSAKMRDSGRALLAKSFTKGEQALWEPPERPNATAPRRQKTDILEYSAVLRAILTHHGRSNWIDPPAILVKRLETATAREVMDHDPDEMPVLRAAKAMCALAVTPDSAFFPSVMVYYYYIVRELYLIDAPEWSSGGARSGETSIPSTYVTWQCIRAISGFHRALLNTAMLLGYVASLAEQRDERFSTSIPERWRRVDAARQALEISTTVEAVRNNVALRLTEPDRIARSVTAAQLDAALKRLLRELEKEIQQRRDGFMAAHKRIIQRRKAWLKFVEEEIPDKKQQEKERRRNVRLETAHAVALQAVGDAVMRADDALKRLSTPETPAEKLRGLQHDFEEAARSTLRIITPAVQYMSHVLDRELAAAAASRPDFWDAPDMAFAAVAFGEAKERWDDDRLARAAQLLASRISDRGQFPLGKPIRTSDRGYRLHPSNMDVIRAFAMLLRNVRAAQVDPDVVKRMMAYMEDTQQKPGYWQSDPTNRWRDRAATASAVLALSAINEMLDERINEIVLGYFSVRRPTDIDLALPDLFYSDYGLVGAGDDIGRIHSVAVVLERLRAHVAGVRTTDYEPLFSLVLHGPPGTGKTMLVESLAKSCNVPLVEITPSDIVIGGADAIERRARAVFRALCLLTRAVILFDEFDPVLLKRESEEKTPSVFSFLTPGMLPKLKELHEKAKKRGVAYVLITNLIGKLDAAAIRNGRFDERMGIYPPDLLSRAGRLASAIIRYRRNHPGSRMPPVSKVWKVVQATAGGPMNTLGRRGWFSAPDEISAREDNAFAFLYGGTKLRIPPAEAQRELLDARNRDACNEYRQWTWIDFWDRTAKKTATRDAALTAPPSRARVEEDYRRQARRRRDAKQAR